MNLLWSATQKATTMKNMSFDYPHFSRVMNKINLYVFRSFLFHSF
jgi:hypothetical protein